MATPPTAPAAMRDDAAALRRQLRQVQMQLRDARTSLEGAHTAAGMAHLKQVLCKYIELDEESNDAVFKVLVTLLGYSAADRKRMERARERRLVGRSSLWGRVLGSDL